MKNTHLVALSAMVAVAGSLPCTASLSKLDSKYGIRRASTPAKSVSKAKSAKTTKKAQPVKAAPVRLSLDKKLQKASGILQAWKAGDKDALASYINVYARVFLPWNQRQLLKTYTNDFVRQMMNSPEELRTFFSLSGFMEIEATDETGVMARIDYGENGSMGSGTFYMTFDKKGCLSILGFLPGKDPEAFLNSGNRARVTEVPGVSFSSENPYQAGAAAAVKAAETAAANGPVRGKLTWGGVDEDFSEDAEFVAAQSRNPENIRAINYRMYKKLRCSSPEVSLKNARNAHIIPFADELYLLGEGRRISLEEFCKLGNTDKTRWPKEGEVTIEPDDIQGGVFTFTATMPLSGSAKPITILVTLLLDDEGKVCGIGETQLTDEEDGDGENNEDSGTEDVNLQMYSWGGVDGDLYSDPVVAAGARSALPIGVGNPVALQLAAKKYCIMHSRSGYEMMQLSQSARSMGIKFAPKVHLIGQDKDISRDEAYNLFSDENMWWPDNLSPLKAAVAGACLEMITRFNVQASDKPVYIKTLMIFNAQGQVSAIGETRCVKLPPDVNPKFRQL